MTVPTRRPIVAALAGLAVAVSGLAAVSGPAQADVSTRISTFPYSQPWSDGGLITTNDDWSGVVGVQGYRGDGLTGATGTDPQTITADGSATPTNVVANATVTATNGGVLEIDGQTIAMQGSGTADAPSLVFHLDLTGRAGMEFSFDARDLDAGADDTNQQVAVQYRVGTSGSYTNLPDGYIADATTGGSAGQVTHRDVLLPASTDGQADVFVRVLTTNAPSNDEMVGIDDISIAPATGPVPVSATDPDDVTAVAGTPISEINLAATGGTPPYSWEVSGLPAGLSETSDGVIGGTPTTPGVATVTVTATDSSTPTAGSDSQQFTITVNPPAGQVFPIAEIQGTDDSSPLQGLTLTTRGVVTAMYPTGGINGIYIQTGGSGGTPDATPGASDGIFVFGSQSRPAGVEVGDSVEVTGEVTEFNGLTEIIPSAGGVVELATPLAPVVPHTVIPGTDCALPGSDCLTGAALDAAKEAHEGEAFQPTGDYTVTDPYDGSAYNGGGFSSSMFGEIGLAAESDQPLVTPTEVEDAQTGDVDGRTAYNNAHRVILDDGSSLNYASSSNTDEPFPWFTPDHTVRVGAAVTFEEPLILDYRFGWKLQPTSQIVGAPTGRITFAQDRPETPVDVGGDLELATFNVLNYFTTLGVDYGGCSSHDDREGNPITVDDCGDTGPRGAWDQVNFERQQAKIVESINTMDADIVSLEEIENSLVVDGHDRDEAVSALVEALNADAGSTRWAFVDSPGSVPASEDVIRTAFIYNPETVALVGGSEIFDHPAFDNARDPFAQTFKAVGGDDADGFAVIANHFKSKGSGDNDGTGQGNANPDRIAQAEALVTFADDFSAAHGVERVFLAGDFNAYSMEDPVQVLTAAGYTSLESTDDPDEETYNFDGMIGSLDHIFANEAAAPEVTGVDIWTTNAYESVYYEYSRFNYNVTQLYDAGPYRASDHNPEIVGIDVPEPKPAATIEVKATPKKVKAGKTRVKLHIEVTGPDGAATGTVVVSVAGQPDQEVELEDGRAQVRLAEFDTRGDKTVTIAYQGDDTTAPATELVTIQVE